MVKTKDNKRLTINNCYLKGVITRQSAYDLLRGIGYRPGEAELIMMFIDTLYKRSREV